MRIRTKSFREWLLKHFEPDELKDIAEHGARQGFSGMIYYQDTSHLYHKFEKELWDILVDALKASDFDNLFDFIGWTFFRRAKKVETPDQFKALLVWYAAERIAGGRG